MNRVSMAEARKSLSRILNRAAYAQERTVVTRHGQDVGAVISMDDLRLLDALIERYEDESDIAAARESLLEGREDTVSWDAIKSASVRIQLAEDLWDSIAVTDADVPLTPAQIEELDRRFADLARDPDAGATWEDTRARLEERIRRGV